MNIHCHSPHGISRSNAIIGRQFGVVNIPIAFKQGRKVLPAVSAVLASLHRMGLVSTADGKTFAFRRAP
ncbi:hypothetical protein HHL25_21960 [Rhizobium sp. S-51]|uniref:Uncharacterized protein n=1 Tax=Rhizobium terricola TaxID=2728849 RepID=A0A7Y0B0B9_9HYPH|nr:hypothetical protein [Rhizobium terricola]NML76809.1 hypothetical protein [Rhizobium terricola]